VQFCGFHFPVPLEDLRDAITFIRANASAHPEWATSPTWVGVWGSSSGGNVAGGLATGWCGHSTPSSTCDTTAGSTKPNAVIAWSPAMNLVDGTGNPVQDGRVPQYLGCNPYSDPPTCTDPDLTAKASPEYNVTSDDAPIFVAGSLKDTITPMDTQVAPMATALQSAGIDTQLYQIAGSCHGVKCKTSDANLESNSANWEHAHLDAQQPTVNIASGPLHPSQLSVATLAFSSRASGVSMTCSLDGAAFVACTSPKSYSSLQQGNHTFSVRVTNGSGTGATSTLAWSFVPLAVSITDSGYTPKSPTTVLGGSVQWTNAGPSQHTVTDKSGMGLFDSGTMAVGAKFTQTFVVAGTYNFLDSLNPSLTGSIKNPLVPSATSGPAGSSFTIQWGFALPPSGYTYEVQMKAPGASSFSNWQTGASATQAAVTLSSVGTYQFRAHLKRTSSGKSCAWSPTLSITTS